MKLIQRYFLLLFLFTLTSCYLFSQSWQIKPIPLQTRWAMEVSPKNALTEYPRPQMVRNNWQNLNGLWQYAITQKDVLPVKFDGQILVPYPIESALSGVKRSVQPTQTIWYKKYFTKPSLSNGERVLLHFGAVDWEATVFINNKQVGTHTGGYDNFSFDVTDALKKGVNEIKVKVYDPTDEGPNPHGKQVLNPKDIWYTPTTGIWQTVWIETVPRTYINNFKQTTNVDKSTLQLSTTMSGAVKGYTLDVVLMENESIISHSDTKIENPTEQLLFQIKNPRMWSPEDPFLYDLKLKLLDSKGNVIDEIRSYCGMRKVEIKKDGQGFDRIFLNNKFIFNLGVLDQGFWPDGIYTAPTDEALAFDIKAIKSMGFNTIRKHIKREPDRWYYWCDKLGMIVWQDMINPSFNLNEEAKAQFEKESKEHIEELYNHPSITTYTLFNEKWSQYDQERLTKWIKQLDPTRLVNGHSGEYLYVNEKMRGTSPNAYIESDITDVHSYPDPMNSIEMQGKAKVLGEFGGIGVFIPNHQWNINSAWGYINVTPSQLLGKYFIMNQHLKLLEREGLSASIYTQPFDVEGEQNGLMTYDRDVIKIPFEDLRKIHSQLVTTANNLPQVTAQQADITDPGIQYSRLLQEYINGNRESSFLRMLAVRAQQVGDKPSIARLNTDYFEVLKKPYTIEDLTYVLRITNKISDAGFNIVKENAAVIDSVLGERKATNKLMNLIYNEVIASAVAGENPKPDWIALSAKVAPYGPIGEEIFLRAKTIHYLNQKEWQNFASSADEYIGKYGKNMKPDDLNEFAWTVFEKVINKDLLIKATVWSKLSISKKEMPEYLDTYANLLYKMGKTREAITMQERAVNLSKGNEEMIKTLEKMKVGLL